jgi:hypothetical protein
MLSFMLAFRLQREAPHQGHNGGEARPIQVILFSILGYTVTVVVSYWQSLPNFAPNDLNGPSDR